MPSSPSPVHAFCRRILEAPDLQTKLAPPVDLDPVPLDAMAAPDAAAPDPAALPARPAREPCLALRSGAPPLPPLRDLARPEARAACLARFAHHELMAVELFAWALLRWPELPGALRAELLRTLADEQVHCRLYLARLRALGSDLGHHALSDYFWRQVPAISASRYGPRAFLCGMGLTLEQANLDFTLLYRDAFRAVGDEASARVCQRVHDDELRHVALAARWLPRLAAADGVGEVEAYEQAVPFPLSAARAKGRRFDVGARRRAGLSEAFITHVRRARSAQERAGSAAGRRP